MLEFEGSCWRREHTVKRRGLGGSLGAGLACQLGQEFCMAVLTRTPLRNPFFFPSVLIWSRPHFHVQMEDFARLRHDLGL